MKPLFFSISLLGSYAAVITLGLGSLFSLSYVAHAVEAKPCYQQFSEAKKAGTLTEKNFKEYKVAHCEKVAKLDEKSVVSEPKKEEKSVVQTTKEPVKDVSKKETVENVPTSAGDIVFPNKVDPKFANEKEGKARMMTCQEQYKTNKVSGKNGGLKWIQKGGGYYSECNKHLKTAAK